MSKSHKALMLRSLICERKMQARNTPADDKLMRQLADDLGLDDPTQASLGELFQITSQAFDLLNDMDQMRDKAENDLALEQFDLTVTPNPPGQGYWRTLCAIAGSQRKAARMLNIDARSMRRWCCGERQGPWASAELLRRMLKEREPQDDDSVDDSDEW